MKITYKFVLNSDGTLLGVELWQNGQHITISMAAEGTHKNGYRWREVKEFLDNIEVPKYTWR